MPETENPGRERILKRIQSALRERSVTGHAYSGGQIFTPVENPLARFQDACKENQTECLVTPDLAASAAAVSEVLATVPPGEIFVQDSPLLRRMATAWSTDRQVAWSGAGRPSEAATATITLAESLVAATGSVFVSAACGGRGASIVAPVHIVVATISQLAPDLTTVFGWMRQRGTVAKNSALCLITGPSRTGDIEKILVMGAHGPRRFVVVLSLSDDGVQ